MALIKSSLQPLHWPEDFPPCAGLRAAFYGFDWPGPDTSFFAALERQQEGRTPEMMRVWQDQELESCALLFGECLSEKLGWRTPYFFPGDCLPTVLYGPKLRNTYDIHIDLVAREFEKRLRRTISKTVWQEVVTDDKSALFGKAIYVLASEQNSQKEIKTGAGGRPTLDPRPLNGFAHRPTREWLPN
jgi:hypothetical protein